VFSQHSAATSFLVLIFKVSTNVIFEFGGNLQDIVISHNATCAVAVAETQEVGLFSNLTAGVKPIAAKS